MILKLSKTKRLSFYRKTEIYIGEKDFDEIQVLIPSEVDENDTSELTFKLHLVNERGEYAIRTLTVEQDGTKVVGSTSITADLTSVAQEFSVYIEMVKGNDEVIGKTNVLEIKVNPLPDEQGEIIPEDIERQRVIVSSTNPPSEAHKKYLLNALWVNYADKTQFVLTSIDESQAPEKYVYTWERNNNHVVVSTEVAPEYTPDNVDYRYSNGDMWIQADSETDKIVSISVCTGYTKESIDSETWRYNYTWVVSSGGVTSYDDLTDKPSINGFPINGDIQLQYNVFDYRKLGDYYYLSLDSEHIFSYGGATEDFRDRSASFCYQDEEHGIYFLPTTEAGFIFRFLNNYTYYDDQAQEYKNVIHLYFTFTTSTGKVYLRHDTKINEQEVRGEWQELGSGGSQYTLTEQDKEDIANIVAEKLSNSGS